jgi:hypothetical protein
MKIKEIPKHYWNMRIVTYVCNNERLFSIAEVHYDKGIPSSYGKKGSVLCNHTSIKGLIWSTNRIKECLKKPALDLDNWPKEWKDNTLVTFNFYDSELSKKITEKGKKELQKIKNKLDGLNK